MKLQPGDLFATNGDSLLSKAIRVIQWWWSSDNEATYNHVGIYIGAAGIREITKWVDEEKTLEARWRFREFLLKDYLDRPILIVRHNKMTLIRFYMGIKAIQKDLDNIYPMWRLPLHLLHVAKVFAFGPGVCSEQTGKFMKGAGFMNVVYGITPDNLADRWRIDRDMTIIFEGVLTQEVLSKLTGGAE